MFGVSKIRSFFLRITPRRAPLRRTGSWRSRWTVSEMEPQFDRRASIAAGQINQAFELPTGQRVTVSAVVRSLQTQGCDVSNKRAQRRISKSQVENAARDAAAYNRAVHNAHETRAAAYKRAGYDAPETSTAAYKRAVDDAHETSAATYNRAVEEAHETRAGVSRSKSPTLCPSFSEDVLGELAALQGQCSFSEEVFSALAALGSRR